ncbi:hypothetical protein [Methylobacterium nonmethylotrophicum]|uniref:Uncharacterized protein n=1 Tax=Methylobacterium nonmethylotrophicum TaxID=1141884 RepID=A0A4Z0NSX0_9HYPH|nr:hypothetical protein [Methylobacterium nonmethylotrophicum]TGD99749.1 hypothetical protein EU555_11290 [Methylobacterium nonmethylotrophicum]
MEIVLEYLPADLWPCPVGWTIVGRVGSQALAYDPERRPFLLGDGEPQPLDPAEVNAALVDAVAAAAIKVWPGGWTNAFPLAFGLNRRTTQPDKIAKKGLNPVVLRSLAFAAKDYDAPGMGALLSAIAFYADRFGTQSNTSAHPHENLADAEMAADNAFALLREVRQGKTLAMLRRDREERSDS